MNAAPPVKSGVFPSHTLLVVFIERFGASRFTIPRSPPEPKLRNVVIFEVVATSITGFASMSIVRIPVFTIGFDEDVEIVANPLNAEFTASPTDVTPPPPGPAVNE